MQQSTILCLLVVSILCSNGRAFNSKCLTSRFIRLPSLLQYKIPANRGGGQGGDKLPTMISRQSSTYSAPSSTSPTALSSAAQRIVTGLLLWIAWTPLCLAGKPLISLAVVLPLIQALREYHNMLSSTPGLHSVGLGVGMLSALLSCFLATYRPDLHAFSVPLSVTALLLQVLFSRRDLENTGSITASAFSATFVGYFLSFWVRLLDVTSVDFLHLSKISRGPLSLTSPSFLLWWSVCIVASADIGGYLVGTLLGGSAMRLSALGVAAGVASPAKTLQGLFGGVLFAIAVSLAGVFLLRPVVHVSSGSVVELGVVFSLLYGAALALLGFVSDVSVSLFKRNAGVKDSGGMLPGHGGVLDRMDSYVLTGPAVVLFWTLIAGVDSDDVLLV